jgi:dTDP-L-rhamnose 4-epimerase
MSATPEQILITGGAGFIGSFLAERFVADGRAVRVLDNFDPQVHGDAPPTVATGIDLRVGDVRDKPAVAAALEETDVVVHAAAAVGVAQSLYRVRHYVDTNVGGTAVLLEAIAERKRPLRRLVVLTSMTGYGEGVYRRASDGRVVRPPIRTEDDVHQRGWDLHDPDTHEVLDPVPTAEDAALLAGNVYALTKRYQEELSLSLGRVYGFPVTCLRLFNVYGPRQSLSNPYTGVLAIFLSRLLNGQPPVVYEDGRQTRDFVSVHDVVRAVTLAIERPEAVGAVFNVGTGVPRPIGAIAGTLARMVGRDDLTPDVTGQFRRGDVRHCFADASRIRVALGFEPATIWEDGLREILEWSRTAVVADRFERADGELRERGLVSSRNHRGGGPN